MWPTGPFPDLNLSFRSVLHIIHVYPLDFSTNTVHTWGCDNAAREVWLHRDRPQGCRCSRSGQRVLVWVPTGWTGWKFSTCWCATNPRTDVAKVRTFSPKNKHFVDDFIVSYFDDIVNCFRNEIPLQMKSKGTLYLTVSLYPYLRSILFSDLSLCHRFRTGPVDRRRHPIRGSEWQDKCEKIRLTIDILS